MRSTRSKSRPEGVTVLDPEGWYIPEWRGADQAFHTVARTHIVTYAEGQEVCEVHLKRMAADALIHLPPDELREILEGIALEWTDGPNGEKIGVAPGCLGTPIWRLAAIEYVLFPYQQQEEVMGRPID